MNCLGSWRVERYWLQSPPLSCYMTGVLEMIFFKRPTIALLLQRISHVAHCAYILTKALLVFILLLKIAYVELMVGDKEACTCVTYIAKSNNGSMGTTNHTSWSRLCTCVEGGWWKWNTPFMNHSLLYLDIMRTWIYRYLFLLFLFFHGHWCVHFFLFLFFFFGVILLGHAIFFFDSPCLIWRILESERSLNM